MKSSNRSSTGCQSFPPRPPSTAVTLRQESLTTLRRRGPKIISTNLTATWSTKCQGCPDPLLELQQRNREPSALMKVTWKVTSSLTAKFIVGLVTFAVTLTITFAVRLVSRTPDFALQFGFAPAVLEAVVETPSRPLIPPSQPRREGSAAEMGKTIPKNGAGANPSFEIRTQITLQQCG